MEQGTGLTRRRLLGTAAGAAGAAALAPVTAEAHHGHHGHGHGGGELLCPRQNIGIQLWTVRDLADADLPGLLQLLADIGYREIEPFSYHGRTPEEFRALLDDAGLRLIGFHVGWDRWTGDRDAVFEEMQLLKTPFAGVSGIFPNPPATTAAYREIAATLNQIGEEAADAGIRFYWHNHAYEFARDRGRYLYDILVEETDPDLVFFELDIYWAVTGGVDPLRYLESRRQPQWRWPLFHAKDRDANGDFADLGTGTIDFARIFSALDNKHYHHYLVERDSLVHPAETARIGYEYLRNLRARRGRWGW
jgi:sugar phosphate isomerase/epimerase